MRVVSLSQRHVDRRHKAHSNIRPFIPLKTAWWKIVIYRLWSIGRSTNAGPQCCHFVSMAAPTSSWRHWSTVLSVAISRWHSYTFLLEMEARSHFNPLKRVRILAIRRHFTGKFGNLTLCSYREEWSDALFAYWNCSLQWIGDVIVLAPTWKRPVIQWWLRILSARNVYGNTVTVQHRWIQHTFSTALQT